MSEIATTLSFLITCTKELSPPTSNMWGCQNKRGGEYTFGLLWSFYYYGFQYFEILKMNWRFSSNCLMILLGCCPARNSSSDRIWFVITFRLLGRRAIEEGMAVEVILSHGNRMLIGLLLTKLRILQSPKRYFTLRHALIWRMLLCINRSILNVANQCIIMRRCVVSIDNFVVQAHNRRENSLKIVKNSLGGRETFVFHFAVRRTVQFRKIMEEKTNCTCRSLNYSTCVMRILAKRILYELRNVHFYLKRFQFLSAWKSKPTHFK